MTRKHHHAPIRASKARTPRRRGVALLLSNLREAGESGHLQRYIALMLVPVVLVIGGTAGYMVIEGENTTFLQSLYMTIITLTTVGYGEYPSPLSPEGRVFTMCLLLGGVFTLFWAAGEMIRTIVSGEVRGILERRRMERSLAELDGHLIVCGYGRMGQRICQEFSQQDIAFVVLDRNQHLLQGFELPHGIAVQGDAASDELLKRVGVERARALVTVLGSDADNLYITMSARLLNENLYIVARCEEEQTQQKLLRAGADRVVAPYAIGGSRVAQAVLRPTVLDFIDLATRSENFEIQMEETLVRPRSALEGATISSSLLHKNHGVFIVAIKKASGQMVYNPPGDTVFQAGDTLIALGHRTQLGHLDRLAGA
jgi:voltage-gated potassium channel